MRWGQAQNRRRAALVLVVVVLMELLHLQAWGLSRWGNMNYRRETCCCQCLFLFGVCCLSQACLAGSDRRSVSYSTYSFFIFFWTHYVVPSLLHAVIFHVWRFNRSRNLQTNSGTNIYALVKNLLEAFYPFSLVCPAWQWFHISSWKHISFSVSVFIFKLLPYTVCGLPGITVCPTVPPLCCRWNLYPLSFITLYVSITSTLHLSFSKLSRST